ncbi:MAG: hypothetical protein R3B40_13935 [Polyangiales bacterium]
MTRRASDLLLTPLHLLSLGAWAFNDHVLQRFAPGTLSGKLGDAASLIAFPILVAATLAPLARLVRFPERHLVDAAALGTALLLAAIQFHAGVAHAYQWALGGLQYALGWSTHHGLAVHTMDPTDALVTPLAVLPMLAVRGVRLTDVLRWRSVPLTSAVIVSCLTAGCGGQVWAAHTDLRLHGGATANAQADHHHEIVGEHRSGAVGVSADVRARVQQRAALGVIAASVTGWVADVEQDYADYGAYTDRYHVASLAPTLTLLGDNVIVRAGVGVTLATGHGQRVGRFRVFPFGFVRLEPGRPGRVHAVIQIGSTDGFMWDARVLSGGGSFPFRRGHVALGIAGGARIGPALHGTSVPPWAFATRMNGRGDFYGWLELQVQVSARASLLASIQAGAQLPVASLGLRWDFDPAGAPPVGAIRPELALPSGR